MSFISGMIGCVTGYKVRGWQIRTRDKETEMRKEFERLTALHERRLKRLQEGKDPFSEDR